MASLPCVILQVQEVNLFRERRTHVSKGCGFITMQTREQAIAVSSQPCPAFLVTDGVLGLLEQPFCSAWGLHAAATVAASYAADSLACIIVTPFGWQG